MQRTPEALAGSYSLALDTLLSPQTDYSSKQQAWQEIRQSGKLDDLIKDLEQRTAANQATAEIPAALGQAYLQKAGTISDLREQGILAMKADKVFDAALEADPSNWDARFTKAMAMSHWPAQLGKSQEVIDHFTRLIFQQEAGAPQPHYAQSYVWLGDFYKKQGQQEYARTAWERGASLYPSDGSLFKRLTELKQATDRPVAARN